MSTKITAENGAGIAVGQIGITVTHPEGIATIWARLSQEQRRVLADALVPGRDFSGVDWKAMYVSAAGERDAAFARAEKAERDRDDAMDAETAALGRAKKAEQLIPAYAMLDIWMAIGRDSIHFDDWYDEHGYADAWAELTAAVREARTSAAVTSADIEKVVWDWSNTDTPGPLATDLRLLTDSLDALLSGDDPAVHVVRESHIAAVNVERHEGGGMETPMLLAHRDENPSVVRGPAANYLQCLTEAEALARAIEGEQATDPLLDKARELWDVAHPPTPGDGGTWRAVWEQATEAERDRYLRMAAHVLGQEANDA